MESFVLYCTFNYALAALLSIEFICGIDYAIEAGSGTGLASVASIKTLDTGMVGALIVAGVAVWLHNRYFDTKLPEWLGVFRGSSFVAMIGFPVMIGLAVIFIGHKFNMELLVFKHLAAP
ncbi:MAG: PTS transporter subunit EIIC [Thomasclavelia ramosa]